MGQKMQQFLRRKMCIRDRVYRALRNHYRLVKLYDTELNVLHAGIERINFNTSYGVPEDNWSYQESWESLKTWLPCPVEQLLMTFMPEARNEDSDQEEKRQFEKIGLEMLCLLYTSRCV